MSKVKQFLDDVTIGFVAAQCGAAMGENEKQKTGVRLILFGAALGGFSPMLAFGQQAPTAQQAISNTTTIIGLLFKMIAVAMALGGFVYFCLGVMWAIRKSRPEYATQITVGQIIGGMAGGPALGIAGVLFFMVINSLFGNNSGSVGQSVQVNQS